MLCFPNLHLRFVPYISNTQYMLEIFETILVGLFTFNISFVDVPSLHKIWANSAMLVVYVLQLFIKSKIGNIFDGNRKIPFFPFV